jgi:hypothetical protein
VVVVVVAAAELDAQRAAAVEPVAQQQAAD